MYLKSLKLVGFKSFADRTRLELRPGVTVIVGPNGSGKSNLVDAVSWVMGTQSTKSLRTPKMEDVVFAGTATRPALNRAEVTLVFDNESRTLPLDLDEVSFTRRLYRDGSSDYELNGVACRLLDIQELLSDSGVGRHQHVIVGQGQIDNILNSGPLDHRAVIEEAAGILKHRQRKDRAIRRLERTDADVVRLQDLVGELARQMRPLKRQANAAEQQAELSSTVRSLRLYLGGERLRSLDERCAALHQEQEMLEVQVIEGEAEQGELAGALSILTAEAGEVGEALDRDTAAAARLETIMERLRRSASVARERHRAAVDRRDGAEDRRRDLQAERSSLETELIEIEAEAVEIEADAQRRERRFRALEDEARSLADQEGLSPEGALVVARGEVRALEAAETRDGRELEQLQHRIEVIEAQIGDEASEAETIKAEIRRLDDDTSALQKAYERTVVDRKARQEHWEAIETQLDEARLSLASARARLDAVRAAAEGSADPEARQLVVDAAGHRGSLASLLDVPAELAPAIDAALGPWADAGAFDSRASLQAAVHALKSEGRGGVPVVATHEGAGHPARRAAEQSGMTALIDRLGPRVDRGLAEAMLGDVLLVEGWSAAVDVVARHPEVRAVTPEGDLISAHGVRVAHPDGATPAMVEAAEVELERAETEHARIESLHKTARRDFDASRQSERQALEALEAAEARISGATEALGRISRSQSNLEGELARLEARRQSLQEGSQERAESLRRLRERLAALEGEEAERQRVWEEMEATRTALEEAREEARASWQEVTANLHAVRERLALLRRRRDLVETSLEREIASPVGPGELDRLELVESTARRALETLTDRLEELRTRQAELRRRAGAAGTQREAVRSRHEAARKRLEEARQRLGQIEVETTEIRVRRENVAEGLRRDADADEATALAAPRPDLPDVDEDADLGGILDDMEARLRRMGPVNPLAAAEYAELQERHGFITDQLSDLEASRDELRRVIHALDDEIEKRFTSAFEEVASAYEEHFSILFPGGAGRLRLTDPDDALTTGVEIQAQPLGKKVSQLSLLSGGERSLAALAFLFAVFKARPSPFYILDEVEAALDDANLRRFLRLVEAFRRDAQLVIVTHQQQTMEAANVLYGVTMEPGGSSSVLRKALDTLEAALTDVGQDRAPA